MEAKSERVDSRPGSDGWSLFGMRCSLSAVWWSLIGLVSEWFDWFGLRGVESDYGLWVE